MKQGEEEGNCTTTTMMMISSNSSSSNSSCSDPTILLLSQSLMKTNDDNDHCSIDSLALLVVSNNDVRIVQSLSLPSLQQMMKWTQSIRDKNRHPKQQQAQKQSQSQNSLLSFVDMYQSIIESSIEQQQQQLYHSNDNTTTATTTTSTTTTTVVPTTFTIDEAIYGQRYDTMNHNNNHHHNSNTNMNTNGCLPYIWNILLSSSSSHQQQSQSQQQHNVKCDDDNNNNNNISNDIILANRLWLYKDNNNNNNNDNNNSTEHDSCNKGMIDHYQQQQQQYVDDHHNAVDHDNNYIHPNINNNNNNNTTTTTTDEERLLMIQYGITLALKRLNCCYNNTNNNNNGDGDGNTKLSPSAITTTTFTACSNNIAQRLMIFRIMILPLLLVDNNNNNNNNNTNSRYYSCSDELFDAIFNVLFVHNNNNNDSCIAVLSEQQQDSSSNVLQQQQQQQWLVSCLDYIIRVVQQQQQHDPKTTTIIQVWKISCRIVRRLYQYISIISSSSSSSGNTTIMQQQQYQYNMQIPIWKTIVTLLLETGITIIQQSHFDTNDISTTIIITTSTTSGATDNNNNNNHNDTSIINTSSSSSSSSSYSVNLSSILLPIVTDLLPILIEAIGTLLNNDDDTNDTIHGNDTSSNNSNIKMSPLLIIIQNLWTSLWKYYHCDAVVTTSKQGITSVITPVLQNWDDTLLSSSISPIMCAITSVLCSILPSMMLLQFPLSIATNNTDDTTIYTPLYTYIPLWTLIQRCLRLGLLYNVDHRGRRRTTMMNHHDNNNSSSNITSLNTRTTTPSATTKTNMNTIRMYQLHRRRGLYLLRAMIDNNSSINTTSTLLLSDHDNIVINMWRKYVSCFEVFEMESEQHLIDQVWSTIVELFQHMTDSNQQNNVSIDSNGTTIISQQQHIQPITWDWMKLLLGRVLVSQDSPIIRKLSLFRLFKGQAGIRLEPISDDKAIIEVDKDMSKAKKSNKGRSSKGKSKVSQFQQGASITVITVDFLFTVIICSFDTLMSSVGTNMQATAAVLSNSGNSSSNGGGGGWNGSNSNVAVSEDMIPLLCNFVSCYLQQLIVQMGTEDTTKCHSRILDQLEEFFRRLFSIDILDGVHHKLTVFLFEAIARTMQKFSNTDVQPHIPLRNDTLRTISNSFQLAFSDGSMISAYKDSLLVSLATILENSIGIGQYTPLSVLDILALYPLRLLDVQQILTDEKSVSLEKSPVLSLARWVKSGVKFKSELNVEATVATAFVDGMLLSETSLGSNDWNPKSSCTARESNIARAIVLLCILSKSDNNHQTASEILWPAIHKGLSHASGIMVMNHWIRADRVSRALLLLDSGVQFRVLSGVGNGDLVVDKKSQNMLPPPHNIEVILGLATNFILHHVKSLVVSKNSPETEVFTQASRSNDARVLSTTFANLVDQLQSLAKGFPSSTVVSSVIDGTLRDSVVSLLNVQNGITNRILDIAMIFITFKSNGSISDENLLPLATKLLYSEFDSDGNTFGNVQSIRSIFQFSKWGALSSTLTEMVSSDQRNGEDHEMNTFLDDLFDLAAKSVECTPSTALVPLFDCVVMAANARFVRTAAVVDENGTSYYHKLEKVIQSLFTLIDACDNNSNSVGMIDEICLLIFQPALMMSEYKRWEVDPDCCTPIRDAFGRIMLLSGTERPHISKILLSRICASWLKTDEVGLSAIPYRDYIVELLVHKEDLVPVTSSFTYNQSPKNTTELHLAPNTNDTSISRGFLHVFFSKLPDFDNKLHASVQSDLLQYAIVKLLHLVNRPPPTGAGLIMYGTPEYCVKIRALQALCILSRFVSVDIAVDVCKGLFDAMGKTAHNQIRYFLEVFTLRFARLHAGIFIQALVEQIRRTDLPLQMIASLMIISGNLIVGRYKHEFYHQYEIGEQSADSSVRIDIHSILAGVVPWLSSTQGFSRGIAQLLTHELIPLVVKVDDPVSSDADSQWYLRSLYRFLDENPDMKRLRRKQQQFFDKYEVDSVCTPEGLASIPVDEGNEANPVHLIEIIKECLQEVYDEANIDRAPLWKQMEVANACSPNDVHEITDATNTRDVNFQRKIIPIDELNIAMDDIREQKHRNMIGRKKQNLIVCATLIDKVPNLGGLARTSEIFAVNRLIVPDIQVTKMDNFKNLCVGAGDWIEIEECKEQNLLSWLRQHRDEGYTIVGLEQTSSSESLMDYTFPSSNSKGTILLLGKEKEGIPVEYLQVIDQCLEIPQYGIIRSLNVHVSGAIAIWEYTKQQQQTQQNKIVR